VCSSDLSAGGFRKNIKDSSKQREIEEEERIVKTEEVQERVIQKAADDYQSRPTDVHAIQKYAKSLLERGAPEDEKTAYNILIKGYKETQSYRFKQAAGDIKIRVGRRQLLKIKKALKASPEDVSLRAKYDDAYAKILASEIDEYTERVKALPTDLQIKYELGRRHFELKNYDKAIEQFQQAQSSPGISVKVLNYLGQSFAQMGWLDESAGSFRNGIDRVESETSDLALELRYGLMDALDRKAHDQSDLAAAEEAFKLASGIAIQQINYKDIRERRQKLQDFIKGLKAAG